MSDLDLQPVPAGRPLTMSSREIAEVVGSRHDKVKQSIERLVERGVIVRPPMGDEQDADAMGRQRTTSVYHLQKRDSYVVVAQLSPEFTACLVDRWQELEDQARQAPPPTLPDLSDPVVLVQLLTEHASKRIEAERRAASAEAQVEAVKPKTQFFDQFVNAEGLYGLQNAGRVLGERPNKFVSWLKQGYVFYQGGALIPRAIYRDKGIFEVRADIIDDKARHRTYVTPKGLSYFARKLGKPDPQEVGVLPIEDRDGGRNADA